jgi:DNA-binding NarL/FixJ family response regulator
MSPANDRPILVRQIRQILLIERDPSVSQTICATLAAARGQSFEVVRARELSEGVAHLRKGRTDAVLLQLSLPEGWGIEALDDLFRAAPDIPVVILAENEGEDLATQAVSRGAHEYLLPSQLDRYSLPRALRNAIENKKV